MALDDGADQTDTYNDNDNEAEAEVEAEATARPRGRRRKRRPKPPKRWAIERDDDALARRARARNIFDVDVAKLAAPASGDVDVDSHAASIATMIGATKSRALAYCDIGLMFGRMPAVGEWVANGVLGFDHLSKMARAITAVSDENIGVVERRILEYLRPRRDLQALPGPRTWYRKLREIVEQIEELSTPPDDDNPKPPDGESFWVGNDAPGDYGEVGIVLRKDRAAVFEAVVRAVRDKKVSEGEQCTLADAVMHLCNGDVADVKVVLNVYADADADLPGDAPDDATEAGGRRRPLRLWMDGAGWLSSYLTRQWLEQADKVRLSADSEIAGYVPSDAQKARVRGRDGVCRFPGCDVPAHRCQIDHVVEWGPGRGGRTATWNMHCLCRTHHNVKTAGLWDVEAHPDGHEVWSSADGEHRFVTEPHGPLAGFGRQTFDARATRLTAVRAEYNARRMAAEEEARARTESARLGVVGADAADLDAPPF